MPLSFNFLGNCHNFSLALYELSNLPLCLLYGERELEISDPLTGLLHKKFQPVLIHAGVIWAGCFYDETGNQGEPGALLQEFKYHNPEYSFTKIFEIDSPNALFHSVLEKTSAYTSDLIIQEFKARILSQKGNGKFPFLEDEE
jgi:hypothetical protein